ncbi:probable N-acetyltransferase camello [Microcaecilia unicolor]|uniref:Probable N-acetyltransferase camello n=1 Tax=Microcaecilia unicolor TaxID=1415580 RepID=A0A6P7X2X2_9AMPH|nr:probable N-acetyltransferase camello [Microcaecilia unicolor]XP_030046796.1 probable N-acetyltransferase camello [Microcaecilia unicolor]XP_030046797.1 probable N-acetyltransferase camello [Microcaecilia unicolor]XP_030046798.1 probable N-acetyltransferase camello [Microcaecilia unicolor]
MSDYHVRKYKDSDYEAVRTIFVDGMIELIPNATLSVLKNPRIHFLIICMFLVVLICSKSFLFSVLAIALLLAANWHFIKVEFHSYVNHSLRDDLLDIQKSYLENDDSCFWVAESNGVVMGMVGAQLRRNNDGEPKIELKRMSVKKCYRKGGVAKALCRTVLNFARQRGYNAVVLETSQSQYAAHRLYESMGFKKLYELPLPTYFGKLINFGIFFYRYDIQPGVK